MSSYSQNIHNLSLTDLVRNIEQLEARVAEDKKQIKLNEERGVDAKEMEAIRNGHQIQQNKLDVNLRALDEIADAAFEEMEQLKREGKWYCEEQHNKEEG